MKHRMVRTSMFCTVFLFLFLFSSCDFIISLFNDAPVASSVTIAGSPVVGDVLTGSYAYSDIDGDPEGPTTFQWYRADDAAGTNAAAIPNASQSTYTLAAADASKCLIFEVVPFATGGVAFGEATRSTSTVPVITVELLHYGWVASYNTFTMVDWDPATIETVIEGGFHYSFTDFYYGDEWLPSTIDVDSSASGSITWLYPESAVFELNGEWTCSSDDQGLTSVVLDIAQETSDVNLISGTVTINSVERSAQEMWNYILAYEP